MGSAAKTSASKGDTKKNYRRGFLSRKSREKNPPAIMDFTVGRQDLFLKLLAKGHTIAAAAECIEIARTTIYRHRAADANFAAAMEEAQLAGIQALEEEAVRRAFGYQEPVVHQGQLSYRVDPKTGELELDQAGRPIPLTITKHSDTLLMFTLKARDRSRYADRHEVTGANEGPIETVDITNVRLSARDKLIGLTKRLTLERTTTTERVTLESDE